MGLKFARKKSMFDHIKDGKTISDLTEGEKKAMRETHDIPPLLLEPDLFEIINKEFDKKMVGEEEARKTIFLISSMRLVENLNKATDNLMLNDVSGVGKDHVSEGVFGLIPNEEKEELIRISPKVLGYTRNKILEPNATWNKTALRLEDVENSVLNDNAFKVMTSANPNKMNKTKIVWKGKVMEYLIEGKPSIIMTIANPNPKEEQLRRFPICNLDEGRDQTREIMIRQAEYASKGLTIEYDDEIIDSLKCLKRVMVKIPYAEKLVDLFNTENVIARTHFPRFLDYIKTSCALHQFQREKDKDEYFIAESQDYDIARKVLIKTTSNILMIPLTKIRKEILNVFESYNLENKSIDDLEDFKEIDKLNITPEWLRIQINFLVSKTFLNKSKERREDEAGRIISKPIFVYSYNKLQKLEIPTWKGLTQTSSNSTNRLNSSNSSNSSNSRVNEVNEVNERERHMTTLEELKKEMPEKADLIEEQKKLLEGGVEHD